MKKSTKNKLQKNIVVLLAVAVFLAIIILLILGVRSYLDNSAYFKIKRVVLNGLENREFAQKISSQFLYENIFNLNLSKIKEDLKISNPQFYDLELARNFPDQLTINIIERKPVVQIKYRGFFLMDREGVIVSDRSTEPFSDFLVISGLRFPSDLSFGKKINLELIKSGMSLVNALNNTKQELISVMPELSFDKVEIDISNKPSLYVYCDTVELRFYDDSLAKGMASLKMLLPTLKDNIKQVKYIDLRFAEPAVSFEK